jgi:hypothetical protein
MSLLAAASLRTVLIAALALSAAMPLQAKTPVGADWQRVQALRVGTDIQVKAYTRPMTCTVRAVDADSLTCRRNVKFDTEDVVFQRVEIATVKIRRRGRSAVLGGVIGLAAGASAGAIVGRNNTSLGPFGGAYPLALGSVGLFAGAPIGYFTDFSATTIYRVK